MKTLRFFGFALVAMIIGLCAVACSSDDDEEGGINGVYLTQTEQRDGYKVVGLNKYVPAYQFAYYLEISKGKVRSGYITTEKYDPEIHVDGEEPCNWGSWRTLRAYRGWAGFVQDGSILVDVNGRMYTVVDNNTINFDGKTYHKTKK